jgi:hypothetical protein
MKKLKSFLGYAAAVLCTFIVIAAFSGMDFFSRAVVSATGIEISPWFSGGRISGRVEHGEYETRIHEAVFQGLFQPRKKGFVQVDWVRIPPGRLPGKIFEGIDVGGDGKLDFTVECDTEKAAAAVTPLNPMVLGLEKVYRLKDGLAVRVWLDNPGR